jgi:hypothetical protein
MTIKIIKFAVCLILAGSCSMPQNAIAQAVENVKSPLDENLILNGSFENGTQSWEIPANAHATASTDSKLGEKSLEFVNKDPKSYELITQKIPVASEQIVHYSGWIKGKDLVSDNAADKGAALFVETFGKGKYISGVYLTPLSGTFDWTYVEGVCYLPGDATDFNIGLYMRRGTTGTAWFDNIQVRIEKPEPVRTTLLYPNYRQSTVTKSTTPWEMLLQYTPDATRKRPTVKSSVISADGKTLFGESVRLPADHTRTVVSFTPKRNLPVGKYRWKIDFAASPTAKVQSFDFDIHVLAQMPPIYIDKNGFTVKNGKRLFPLGMYLGGTWSTKKEDLKLISEAGFDTVLSYAYGDDWQNDATPVLPETFLDEAHRHNLKVIYSLKDMYDGFAEYPRNNKTGLASATEAVNRVKGHPALFSWYVNDEFEPEWIPKLKARYELIKTMDPNHPMYQVVGLYGIVHKFFEVSDAWGTDPYPIKDQANRQISLVTDMTRITREAGHGTKAMWQVLQTYDEALYNKELQSRPPTLDEMRNMSYQALINGATGLIYYSYFDLWHNTHKRYLDQELFNKRWANVQNLVTEIKPLTSIILKDNKVALRQTTNSPVQYQAWQDSQKIYMAVVSTESTKAQLSLTLPAEWRVSPDALETKGITVQRQGNLLNLELAPQASGVIVLEK